MYTFYNVCNTAPFLGMMNSRLEISQFPFKGMTLKSTQMTEFFLVAAESNGHSYF